MPDVIRLLFSGSRFHDDPILIGTRLDQAAEGHDQVTLVHGRCDPRTTNAAYIARHGTDRVPWDAALTHPEHGPYVGGDWHAHHHALACGWSIEEYAADWRRHGKAAGGIRNQVMVSSDPKPDQLVAAPVSGQSTGTYDCMRRARAAGIPVEDISQPVPAEGLW